MSRASKPQHPSCEWVHRIGGPQGPSRVAGAGIDFQADMARRSRHAATASARAVAERVRRLPPVSAFGRGHTDRSMSRDAVGMT